MIARRDGASGLRHGRPIVAAVQAAPVFLDRDATIEKVGRLTKEAAGNGAQLVAFPEGFVPTYPDWVWRTTPWADGEWYARWIDQCVDVPGPGVRRARRRSRASTSCTSRSR